MDASAGHDERWLWRAVIAAQFGPAFMFSGVAVALPAMGEDLSMSAASLGLVETTFVASSAAFLLPAGRIADILPRGAVFRWMLVTFGLLTFAIGCVSDGDVVQLLRFVQGITAAMCAAAGPALLNDLVPLEQRGRAFGAMLGTAYAGLALGPLAAGWLVESLGWRSVFFVGAAQILVGGLPVLLWRRERARPTGRGLHLPSSVLVVAGITAIVVAVSAPEYDLSPWPWAILGVALLLCFAGWQLRLKEPLLDLRMLASNGELRGALLVQALLYLNAYCSVLLLSLFLQVGRGLDARVAGMWLAVGAVVMAVVSPRAGRLSDRVRPQLMTGIGALLVAISSAIGLTIGASSPPFVVGLVLGVQGLGFGLFSSPNMSLIVGSVPRERAGFASAIAAQSRGIGMFAGMAVGAAMLGAHFGGLEVSSDPAAIVPTLHDAYVVLMLTSGAAALVALVRRRRADGTVSRRP